MLVYGGYGGIQSVEGFELAQFPVFELPVGEVSSDNEWDLLI